MHPIFIILVIASVCWFFIIGTITKQSILIRVCLSFIAFLEFFIIFGALGAFLIKQDFFIRALRSGPDIGPIIKYQIIPTVVIVFLTSLLFWSATNTRINCPSCGGDKIRMQLPYIATLLLVPSILFFIQAIKERDAIWASIVFFIPSLCLWIGNKKVFCKSCKHYFCIKTNNKEIYMCCPKCKRNLDGVTENMIGDTGVCPKCKTEFELKLATNLAEPMEHVTTNNQQ
jgi:hypothetical protein